jgi:hypothetical protein
MRYLHQCIVVFLLVLTSFQVKAQLFDSIAASFDHTLKPSVQFNTRNAFITNSAAKMRGVNLGVSWNQQTKAGLGFNWLGTSITRLGNEVVNEIDFPYVAELEFWFVSGYFEYAFYRTKHWDISIPVHLGVGRSGYSYRNHLEQQVIVDRQPVVLYEPAMIAVYKPIRWIGIGAGVGYRLMLKNNTGISDRFTSPTYTLRFQVFFGKIWKDLRNG